MKIRLCFAIVITLNLTWRTTYAAMYTVTILGEHGLRAEADGVSDGTQVGTLGSHAVLWTGTAASVVDLHPFSDGASVAWDVSGTHQVGWAAPLFSAIHAMLWSGTAASAVDLHPSGFFNSEALSVSGSSQVGYARENQQTVNTHSMLWHGTAASAIDLHPTGFISSNAHDVSSSTQVGEGTTNSNARHALLWSGTAASVVDLHPSGYTASFASGVSGSTQVGRGDNHALMWNGSAASVVDLHPSGFNYTEAQDVSTRGQVGFGAAPSTGNDDHALLWYGTAESVIDLHTFLIARDPSFEFGDSRAFGIDSMGNIVGVGHKTGSSRDYAILWTPVVPEPASFALLAFGISLLSLARRRPTLCKL